MVHNCSKSFGCTLEEVPNTTHTPLLKSPLNDLDWPAQLHLISSTY